MFDVVAAATAPFAEAGARVSRSVRDLAGSEVVVSMLVEDAIIRDVALGAGGLCESLGKGAIHVVMGTHGVAMVRELEARHAAAGQTLVAAPVLGRPDLAATGQLGVVVGGPPAAVAKVNDLLSAMGRRTFVAGVRPESATAIKLANNAVLGCAMVAMAEGFSLIRKYDVPPQVFQDVMTEGLFAAPAYKIYGQKVTARASIRSARRSRLGSRHEEPDRGRGGYRARADAGRNVYLERLIGAVAHGDGNRDQAVLGREQARAAGLE